MREAILQIKYFPFSFGKFSITSILLHVETLSATTSLVANTGDPVTSIAHSKNREIALVFFYTAYSTRPLDRTQIAIEYQYERVMRYYVVASCFSFT